MSLFGKDETGRVTLAIENLFNKTIVVVLLTTLILNVKLFYK